MLFNTGHFVSAHRFIAHVVYAVLDLVREELKKNNFVSGVAYKVIECKGGESNKLVNIPLWGNVCGDIFF